MLLINHQLVINYLKICLDRLADRWQRLLVFPSRVSFKYGGDVFTANTNSDNDFIYLFIYL